MSNCIIWRGAVNNKGYGHRWINGFYVTAHRYAYRKSKGPIPPGMIVRHTCDNRLCVNPEHLVIGSYKDNMKDATERGRPVGRKSNTSTEARIADILAGLSNEQVARLHNTGRSVINKLRHRLS